MSFKDKLIEEYCKYYNRKVDYNLKPQFNSVLGNNTIAMFLAQKGIIPLRCFYHQPKLQNSLNQTVAMFLQMNKIKIPSNWYHDPKIQSKYGYTVALLQAEQGQIPEKQWEHNRHIRYPHIRKLFNEETQSYDIYDYCVYTVQNFLQENNIEVPEQWKYQVEDKDDNTKEMLLAQKGIISENINNIIPYQTNIYGETIAIMLVKQQIIPPKCCVYKDNDKNYNRLNILFYFKQSKLPIPNEWKVHKWNKQNNQMFQDAIYGIIPEEIQNPEEQNPGGFTIAMIIAKILKQNPQKQYYHDPNIQNMYKQTVASILYEQNIQFDDYCIHKPELQLDDKKNTFAMLCAKNKQIPKQCWLHDPKIRNDDNKTVAMILAENGIIPPKEWEHQSDFQDKKGNTVAMLLANNKIIPPVQWNHDPILLNEESNTVGIILSSKGIVPSDCWMHDINIQYGRLLLMSSIEENLRRHGYILYKEQFIKLQVQIIEKDEICSICLQDGIQYFIKSNCKHNVCCQCFKQLITQEQDRYCPICKQQDWFQIIKQNHFNSQYEQQYNQDLLNVYTQQFQ